MKLRQKNAFVLSLLTASILALSGCGSDNDSSATKDTTKQETPKQDTPKQDTPKQDTPTQDTPKQDKPETYTFSSKFEKDKSSVSYTGQVARHALIDDMSRKFKSYQTGEQNNIDGDINVYIDGPTEDTALVIDKVAKAATAAGFTLVQTKVGDISSDKKLSNKVAGQDTKDDTKVGKVHLVDGKFIGGLNAAATPLAQIKEYVKQLKAQVALGTRPTVNTDAGPEQVAYTWVDGQGRDYNQLVQKFMLGAIAYSQGTADYLKTDFTSKNNQVTGKAYTEAEHKWDEAFGYFGALVDYSKHDDTALSGKYKDADALKNRIVSDIDGDKKIDLKKGEALFGAAVNCAKRDRGSTTKTDFTKEAFDAFIGGRHILNQAAGGEFAAGDKAMLEKYALKASQTWEKCIAATTVHYINDTNGDIQKFVDNGGKFKNIDAYYDLAKHWSEMKGFALSLQFNPDSKVHADGKYAKMLTDMGNELDFTDPALSSADAVTKAKAYQAKLNTMLPLFKTWNGFDDKDIKNW